MNLSDLNRLVNFQNMSPYVFMALSVWTLILKGLALWKAAQNRSKIWFVVLLVINTLGLLELLYLLFLHKITFKGNGIKNPLSPLLARFQKGKIT